MMKAREYAIGIRQYAIDGWTLASGGGSEQEYARRRPAPRLEPDGRERGRGAAAAAEADRRAHARPEEGRTRGPRHDRGLRRGAAKAAAAARRRARLDAAAGRAAAGRDFARGGRAAEAPARAAAAARGVAGRVRERRGRRGIPDRWRRVGAGVSVMFCVLSMKCFFAISQEHVGRANQSRPRRVDGVEVAELISGRKFTQAKEGARASRCWGPC